MRKQNQKIKTEPKKTILEKVHPVLLSNNKTPDKDLGREIMALRYDLILPVIKGMKEETLRQQKNDLKRNRVKLSTKLLELSEKISLMEENINDLVKICSKYIKEEKKYHSSLKRKLKNK